MPRRPLRLVPLLLLAAVLVVPAIAGAAKLEAYYRLPLNDEAVQKPRTIDFHDETLSKLRWKKWGHRTATATGRIRLNTCDPSCANGDIVRGSVRARVFKRAREGDRLIYGCMTATMRGRRVTEWPPGCAG